MGKLSGFKPDIGKVSSYTWSHHKFIYFVEVQCLGLTGFMELALWLLSCGWILHAVHPFFIVRLLQISYEQLTGTISVCTDYNFLYVEPPYSKM